MEGTVYPQLKGVIPLRARALEWFSTKLGLSVKRDDDVELSTLGRIFDILGGDYWVWREVVE